MRFFVIVTLSVYLTDVMLAHELELPLILLLALLKGTV